MIKYYLKTYINKDEAYVLYTSSGLDWQRPKVDMHHPPSAFEFTLSAGAYLQIDAFLQIYYLDVYLLFVYFNISLQVLSCHCLLAMRHAFCLTALDLSDHWQMDFMVSYEQLIFFCNGVPVCKLSADL